MDFLGLSTLTLIQDALDEIKRTEGITLDIDAIPLDDAKTFELFCDGQTYGVFQFESSGMRELLRKAKPERLDDLIALNALYRPGPMDLIPSFVARKHGKEEVEYPHPLVAEMLSETYGIMVYQEQVMQTAQILGGYSLGARTIIRMLVRGASPRRAAVGGAGFDQLLNAAGRGTSFRHVLDHLGSHEWGSRDWLMEGFLRKV
jgi:DNA polymerase-3 subunit alpha